MRACPVTRPRAASTSASVGAVFVANVEHPLKDVTHRRERVELPLLHLVEQPAQLWIVAHGLLDVTAGARGGDLEDLAGEVAATAQLELPLGFQPAAVLGDLLRERLDPLAAHRLGEHDRRPPTVTRP